MIPDGPVLVTGASGFIGGAITERLQRLDGRAPIRSLTSHPAKNRFGTSVTSFAYDFEHPERMAKAFDGVSRFVNTYYVRFPRGNVTFERAVEDSRVLFRLAHQSGVRKIVHVSVSNADERSDLPYYRNKARIERLLQESGVEHTILRPALVMGHGDILINNIAFFLRRLPLFTMFGDGGYLVQPITVDALADIAMESLTDQFPNQTLPVAGPRDWKFLDLVRAIRAAVGSRATIVSAPSWVAFSGLTVAGLILRDVVLTRDEIRGLTRGYLSSSEPLRRGMGFDEWLAQPSIAAELGRTYASELARHFRP